MAKLGLFLTLAIIGTSASIHKNFSYDKSSYESAVSNTNQAKSTTNDKNIIWENTTLQPVSGWSGTFRFSSETKKTGEEIYAFPDDVFERFKTDTFYIDVANVSSSTNIRVTTGWWGTAWPSTDYNCLELLKLNPDGTYTLELNFNGYEIADLIDERHLLFSGDAYTLLNIYFVDPPEPEPYRVLWDNDHTFKDPSWGGGYRFGFVDGPNPNECIAFFSKEDWDNVIKGGTFYIDIEDYDNDNYFQIHVTDGSWAYTWGDFSPYSSPDLTRNNDGTWTLKITFAGSEEFINAIENNNLLFTGGGYSLTRLYCGDKTPSMERRIWTNPYPDWVEPIEGRTVYYRFAPEFHTTGEEIYAFSDVTWQSLKTQTFYLDLEVEEGFNIRVTTGWWVTTWTGDVISPGSEYLIDNGDGTWALRINFEGDPIVDLLDEQHLLFEGQHYRPLGLRLGNNEAATSYVNVFKRESTAFKNKAYIKTDDHDIAGKGAEIILTVDFKDETNKFPYELKVTYNGGLRTCELTQVDEDIYTFIMPNFDVDITAYFDTDYTVKFNWQGHGVQPEEQTVHEGEKVAMPKGQTFADDLVFLGWFKENSGTTTPWDFKNDVITGDMTLYARWDIFVSAELISLPTKVEYAYGEELDLSGGKITVYSQQQYSYTDTWTDIDMISEMITGYDKHKVGEQVLTITYGNISETYTVTVAPAPPVPVEEGMSVWAIVGISIGSALALLVAILLIMHFTKKKGTRIGAIDLTFSNIEIVKKQSYDNQLDEYIIKYDYKDRNIKYSMLRLKTLSTRKDEVMKQFNQLIKNGELKKYSNYYYNCMKRHHC